MDEIALMQQIYLAIDPEENKQFNNLILDDF